MSTYASTYASTYESTYPTGAKLMDTGEDSPLGRGEWHMSRLDHRFVAALMGAFALYLVWHAIAPPYDAAGTSAPTRLLIALVAVALFAAAVLPRRASTAPHPAPNPAAAKGARIRSPRRHSWRSRMAIAHIVSTDTRPVGAHSTADPMPSSTSSSPVASDSVAGLHHGLPERVLVLCDGTSAGDAACRLAQRLSERRQAIVRAVAILPENLRDEPAAAGDVGPIERFLEDVNAQMRRTTPMPASWRLTLIVHDVEGELRRACVESDVDTLLVPSSLRTPDGETLRAASAAVDAMARLFDRSAPIICVVAEEKPTTPQQMRPASLRLDTAALAALRTPPEPLRLP